MSRTASWVITDESHYVHDAPGAGELHNPLPRFRLYGVDARAGSFFRSFALSLAQLDWASANRSTFRRS